MRDVILLGMLAAALWVLARDGRPPVTAATEATAAQENGAARSARGDLIIDGPFSRGVLQ